MVGCASNPNRIDAKQVPASKYREFSCTDIGMEITYIRENSLALSESLQKTQSNDTLQMAAGALLLSPVLFGLSDYGDTPETAEFSRLKGEHQALQMRAKEINCQLSDNLTIDQYLEKNK